MTAAKTIAENGVQRHSEEPVLQRFVLCARTNSLRPAGRSAADLRWAPTASLYVSPATPSVGGHPHDGLEEEAAAPSLLAPLLFGGGPPQHTFSIGLGRNWMRICGGSAGAENSETSQPPPGGCGWGLADRLSSLL